MIFVAKYKRKIIGPISDQKLRTARFPRRAVDAAAPYWRTGEVSCFVGGICTAKISFACRILKFYAAYQHSEIDHDVGTFMSTAQAILFGMMLSWTPSLVLLSWLLWKERIGTEDV